MYRLACIQVHLDGWAAADRERAGNNFAVDRSIAARITLKTYCLILRGCCLHCGQAISHVKSSREGDLRAPAANLVRMSGRRAIFK